MVSCMYIFHYCTLRFEGNKYIIIIIIINVSSLDCDSPLHKDCLSSRARFLSVAYNLGIGYY